MKPADRYRLLVRWSEEDRVYVGHCPDLFPWGGVCHGATQEATFRKLRTLVRKEIARLEMLWGRTFRSRKGSGLKYFSHPARSCFSSA